MVPFHLATCCQRPLRSTGGEFFTLESGLRQLCKGVQRYTIEACNGSREIWHKSLFSETRELSSKSQLLGQFPQAIHWEWWQHSPNLPPWSGYAEASSSQKKFPLTLTWHFFFSTSSGQRQDKKGRMLSENGIVDRMIQVIPIMLGG